MPEQSICNTGIVSIRHFLYFTNTRQHFTAVGSHFKQQKSSIKKTQKNAKNLDTKWITQSLFSVWELRQEGRVLPHSTSAGNTSQPIQIFPHPVHVFEWPGTHQECGVGVIDKPYWEGKFLSRESVNNEDCRLKHMDVRLLKDANKGCDFCFLNECTVDKFSSFLFVFRFRKAPNACRNAHIVFHSIFQMGSWKPTLRWFACRRFTEKCSWDPSLREKRAVGLGRSRHWTEMKSQWLTRGK